MVLPDERGRVTVYSSTQSPTAVQKGIAGVLGLPMHLVEVEVRRLGGAFGGKEDQATAWAAMAALAARHTGRAAKIVLRRHEDVRATGKRHPYSTDFKLGLDEQGKIVAFEAEFFQNSGAAADLSTAIMERTLLHAGNVLPPAECAYHRALLQDQSCAEYGLSRLWRTASDVRYRSSPGKSGHRTWS